MRVAAELLEQEIRDLIPQVPVPPSNVQASVDAKERQLRAIRERVAALEGSGPRQVIGPAWEQRAFERIFETGVRKENELADDLDDDPWDVAAWCDRTAEAGLIGKMGHLMAPQRHWTITDRGRESIGFPSAR